MLPIRSKLTWLVAAASLLASLASLAVLFPAQTASAQNTLSAARIPTPSVFIRWGNDTAPPGTQLVYRGFAYSSFYSHSASGDPIVLAAGDPGPSSTNSGDLLYPLQTGSPNFMPPGITGDRDVVAAVCMAPGPTTTIWGTHNAPPGWTVLYKGYGLGPFYAHNGPGGPICVDADSFDESRPKTGNGGLLYSTKMEQPAGNSGNVADTFVKAAVIMKL